ncbi:MAG TPA: PIN domain nuclease [Terracidiphilus sp.]|nr:PIN domain nuclease [Terracidiphilus sp.]
MVIVDSSVWIDALRGVANPQTLWLTFAIPQAEVGLTSLILCEVLQGVRSRTQLKGFQRDLLELPVYEAASKELAIQSAKNYLRLRALGMTVRSTINCMTATFCIESGFGLLHHDRDYDPFKDHLGLQVVEPFAGN